MGKDDKPTLTAEEKFAQQLTHLAAGVPGTQNDESGEHCVVFVDVPDKKKEELVEWCKENIAPVNSGWKVTSKKGPMKDHPFCFINFTTEEGRESAMEVTEMFDTPVKVVKRYPAVWVNGFTEEDTEETITTICEAAGFTPTQIHKPEGKKWAYLMFATSEAAFEAADTLKETTNPNNDKGYHISFPRNGKEKMALRNRIAKNDEMDENKRKVFCYKIKDTTEAQLKEFYGEFGDIEKIFVRENKGFGFVIYKTYSAAFKACNATPDGWEAQMSKPDYYKKMQEQSWGGNRGGGRWGGNSWGGRKTWGGPRNGGYGAVRGGW